MSGTTEVTSADDRQKGMRSKRMLLHGAWRAEQFDKRRGDRPRVECVSYEGDRETGRKGKKRRRREREGRGNEELSRGGTKAEVAERLDKYRAAEWRAWPESGRQGNASPDAAAMKSGNWPLRANACL